jgi:ArsR family transcriptional regulator
MMWAVRSQPKLARLFHALSDETRLAVLDRLRGGERCVCDLADLLDAGQSRLSFHMKVLKEAGLVADRRDGRWIHYSLRSDALAEAERALASLRDSRGAKEAAACCAK